MWGDGVTELMFFFDLLCFFEGFPELEVVDDGDDEDDDGLDGEVEEDDDAVLLVGDLDEVGPEEHEDPAHYVDGWLDDFVLVVVFEVLEVHPLLIQ